MDHEWLVMHRRIRPAQPLAALPQSRGHLTLGERVEGGQVVEPRRGRHFGLGHDCSLVLMRGLTIPPRMTDARRLLRRGHRTLRMA